MTPPSIQDDVAIRNQPWIAAVNYRAVRISRRSLLLAVVSRAWAQDAKFSAGVDVVTLFATVRNSQGLVVKDLSKDDFLLEEDGVPQIVGYFSRESDLPLKIGLLVDTSQSQLHVLEPERRASYTFLDQVLRSFRRSGRSAAGLHLFEERSGSGAGAP